MLPEILNYTTSVTLRQHFKSAAWRMSVHIQYSLNTELALCSGFCCVRGICVCVWLGCVGHGWGVLGFFVTVLPFCSFSLPPDSTPLGSMPVGVSPFSVSTLSLSSLKRQHRNIFTKAVPSLKLHLLQNTLWIVYFGQDKLNNLLFR